MQSIYANEEAWLTYTSPLEFVLTFDLMPRARGMRLWFAGICRSSWDRLPGVSRAAVEIAEQFADGQVTVEELERAYASAVQVLTACELQVEELERRALSRSAEFELGRHVDTPFAEMRLELEKAERCRDATIAVCPATSLNLTDAFEGWGISGPREAAVALLRDVFGNPFRPVAFDPSWHTSTVLALARQMYDTRDFSPMPILADALQEAGCESADLLDHCRDPGPHVRGCWVVDQVLGLT